MSTLTVVVMGTGGVGGYFGARLARAGHSVTFVARGTHLEALCKSGLSVRSAVEGEFTVAVEAVERLDGRPLADLVVVAVKSFDTDAALTAVRPVVGPATAVLSLQNGVEAIERIDAALGPGHALGGAAYVFASIEAPGIIAHRFAGRIVLGEPAGGTSPRAERVREAIAKAGIPVEVSTDIQRVLWEKYVMICAQAGVTALTRCPTGVVRTVPETWQLYRALAEELAAVGRAAGVALPPGIVDTVVAHGASLAPPTSSSLAFDLSQGKRLELETLHGHAVRLAEKLGVTVPSVFAVYAALKPWLDGPPDPAAAGG